jgi:hypothetical protein
MSGSVRKTFACPACGKRFSWKPAYAGRSMSCSCGRVFEARLGLDAARMSGEIYDIEVDQPAATAPHQPTAELVKKYAYRTRQPVATDNTGEAVFHPMRDLYVPLGLLIAGLLSRGAFALTSHGDTSILVTVAMLLFETIVNTAVMMLGAYFAALFLEVNFGDLATAALKLAGIAVFAAGTAVWIASIDKQHYSVAGMYVAMLVVVLLYFAFFYSLFDIELNESLTTTAIVGAMQLLVMLGMHIVA